jgi:BMC domain
VSGPFLRREGESVALSGPAVALVETTSIARGLVVADAMVKKAPVTLA